MGSCQIETEGKRLRATNQSLIIESIDKADLDIPLIDIDSLIIKGGTTLTSHSILKIIEYGITITFLDYYGNYSCSICSDIMGNVEVRHNQLRLSDDKHRSLQLASVIIQGKISNQIAVLKRYIRNYGDNKEINTSIDRLYTYRDNIKDATSIEAIRGYEGISSREVDIDDFEIDARYGVVCNSDCRSKIIKSWENQDTPNMCIDFSYLIIFNVLIYYQDTPNMFIDFQMCFNSMSKIE